MTKYFFICFIILSIILTPVITVALEVDFPSVGGQKPTDSFGPAQWINYIFLFGLAVVGLAIIYTLVRAGFSWMTAGGGNEGAVKEARDRIKGAVIGLVILLGSVIFLNLINPDLITLKSYHIEFIGMTDYWRELLSRNAGVCNSSTQCLQREGERCMSGKCVKNPNAISSIGKPCDIENRCATGLWCVASNNYAVVEQGQSGICGQYRPIGQTCAPGDDVSECLVGKCTSEGAPLGGLMGKICGGQKRPAGDECNLTSQCASGACAIPSGATKGACS